MLEESFKKLFKNIEQGQEYFTDEFKESFDDFIFDIINRDKYKIKFSKGYENWIENSFIGIRNVEVSESFNTGLYIILLFNNDGSGFYLTFRQGNLKHDFKKQVEIANSLISNIKLNKNNLRIPNGFSYPKSKKNNSISILSKFYNIDNINQFKQDFHRFITIYEYLIMFYNNYENSNFVNIEALFKHVLKEYPIQKKLQFNDNKFVKWTNNEFKKDFNIFLKDCNIKSSNYETEIITGKVNWSNLFWININNKTFETKFENKFYIYILFNHYKNRLEIGLSLSRSNNHLITSRINFLVNEINSHFQSISNQIKFKEHRIIFYNIHYNNLNYDNIKNKLNTLFEVYEYLIPKYKHFLDNEIPEMNDLRNSDGQKIWTINLSHYVNYSEDLWNECKSNSIITLGFIYDHNDIDYSSFKNKYSLGNNSVYDIPNKTITYIWRFVNFIKKGDILVVYGPESIRGIAVVTSDYRGIIDKSSINNFFNIKWIVIFDSLNFNFGRSKHDIFELNINQWNKILFSLSKYNEKLFKRISDYFYNLFQNYLKNTNIKSIFNKKIDSLNSTWKYLIDKKNSGLDISDEIWDNLLLRFFDNDLKLKIQKRENFSNEEMDIVANLFFNTLNNLSNSNTYHNQKRIVTEFMENKYSSKLKSLEYFKIVYYLNNHFYIIDKKIIKVLKLFSIAFGFQFKLNNNLEEYLENNIKFKEYLELINNSPFKKFKFNNFDNFLLFSFFINDDSYNFIGNNAHQLPIVLLENVGVFEELNVYSKIDLSPKLLLSSLNDFAISNNTINQISASLNAGKHIILEGTPGTGKTDLAIKFAETSRKNRFNDGYILTTATSDWSTFDTIGGLMPNQEGVLSFHQGKFLESIAQNKWLIIDEINRADIDKAFGPLFTVLSGQNVELPYKINNNSIKIQMSDDIYSRYDIETSTYLIGKNWRIIGTMNIDDKDSLFDLSYAFMRRFMFIEIDLPEKDKYEELILNWSKELDEYYVDNLIKLYELINFRKIGPAIFKDICEYILFRCDLDDSNSKLILSEAISSFIIPQLEGLNRNKINDIKILFEKLEILEYLEDQLNDLIPMY